MSDIVNLPFVLYLECDDKTMIERLLNRGKTSGRSDDRLDIIQKRLVAHHSITTPVLQYYEKRGKLKRVCSTYYTFINHSSYLLGRWLASIGHSISGYLQIV